MAQALARHSTITLTMDRYSHTLIGEQADALNAFPNLDSTAAERAPSDLASRLPVPSDLVETCVDSNGRQDGVALQCTSDIKTSENLVLMPQGSVCTSGGGPGLQNQWRV